jgi:hypothetical protein
MVFRKLIVGLLALVTMNSAPCASTQEASNTAAPSEHALKAAFVFNFALYTEWPSSALGRADAVTLCVLGDDPINGAMDQWHTKQVQGRRVQHRQLNSPNETKGCNVLYVASSEHGSLTRIAATLQKQPILTVAEKRAPDGKFPVVLLVPVGNRFAFDINRTSANASGLTLSSNLLRLAREVN